MYIYTYIHMSRDVLSIDVIYWDVLSTYVLTRDVLSREVLSRDVLSRDVLSRDILSTCVLTRDILSLCSFALGRRCRSRSRGRAHRVVGQASCQRSVSCLACTEVSRRPLWRWHSCFLHYFVFDNLTLYSFLTETYCEMSISRYSSVPILSLRKLAVCQRLNIITHFECICLCIGIKNKKIYPKL